MLLDRRFFLRAGVACLALGPTAVSSAFAAAPAAVAALDKSKLIYLTPLLADGRESSCQSEIWFVHHKGEVYVSTRMDAWRTQAVKKGLTKARIWVGEFGMWKDAKEAYRGAPTLVLDGKLETDPAMHAELLEVFGKKYSEEWGKWGPRFRDGLADGSRSLLRYQIT